MMRAAFQGKYKQASKDKRYEQVISRLAISSDDIISPTLISPISFLSG